MQKSKKVIILTHPLSKNYGGLLQAFALQSVIRQLGYDVVTDRYGCQRRSWKSIYTWFYIPLKKWINQLRGRTVLTPETNKMIMKHINAFIDDNIRTVEFFKRNKNPSRCMIDTYDIYVIGSDQVWRKKYMRILSYFLDFLKNDKSKIRITYAPSFGKDDINEWSNREVERCAELLKLFNGVSVREKSGCDICKQKLGREVQLVLDPTLLLSKEQYQRLIPNKKRREKEWLMVYMLDMNEEKSKIIKTICERLDIETHSVMPKCRFNSRVKNIEDCVYPSVSDWLDGFNNAKFVVTDSYHGTIFSIIFNKPFISIANKSRGNSRFESLLESLHLMDRLIYSKEDFTKVFLTDLNYSIVNRDIEDLKNISMKFLEDNLK